MAQFIPVNKEQHLNQGWQKPTSYDFTKQDMTIPVLLDELPHVVTTMPLVFTKRDDEGSFELRVLASLEPGKNMYVSDEGQWLIAYVPAIYRSYPFKALRSPETGKPALCFNLDSGLLLDAPRNEEEKLFADDGSPAPKVKQIIEFLQKCEKNRTLTQKAVDTLAKYELLKAFRVKIKVKDQDDISVDGIYTVDERKVRSLDGDALQELNRNNAFAVIYAQLFSQQRMDVFDKLYKLHEQLNKNGKQKSDVPKDLSGILSSNETVLNFD